MIMIAIVTYNIYVLNTNIIFNMDISYVIYIWYIHIIHTPTSETSGPAASLNRPVRTCKHSRAALRAEVRRQFLAKKCRPVNGYINIGGFHRHRTTWIISIHLSVDPSIYNHLPIYSYIHHSVYKAKSLRVCTHKWRCPKIEPSQMDDLQWKNSKMDDSGVPPFMEPPKWSSMPSACEIPWVPQLPPGGCPGEETTAAAQPFRWGNWSSKRLPFWMRVVCV